MIKDMPKGIYKRTFEQYKSRSGKSHWGWKGDKVGYQGLHDWIYKIGGKADHCDNCGNTEKPKGKKRWFEWSCKNNIYTRNIEDWLQLCVRCHREHDEWIKMIQKAFLKSKCWEKRKRDKFGTFIK